MNMNIYYNMYVKADATIYETPDKLFLQGLFFLNSKHCEKLY